VRALRSNRQTRCCIVIADEERQHRFDDSLSGSGKHYRSAEAVIRKGFLRQASVRARRLVSPASVLVCAQEADRDIWEGPLWFT
jgi:hypothetical protein